MGFEYRNLDTETRRLMVEEIAQDLEQGTLHLSNNLSVAGAQAYPGLLQQAVHEHTDDWLASQVRPLLNAVEKPRMMRGKMVTPKMRSNAHEMLAEGEFNRFYVRALCRRAVADGTNVVRVFRAKPVRTARSASAAMIGRDLPAAQLLADLSIHPGMDTALGLPPGPNSGLSAHLLPVA